MVAHLFSSLLFCESASSEVCWNAKFFLRKRERSLNSRRKGNGLPSDAAQLTSLSVRRQNNFVAVVRGVEAPCSQARVTKPAAQRSCLIPPGRQNFRIFQLQCLTTDGPQEPACGFGGAVPPAPGLPNSSPPRQS